MPDREHAVPAVGPAQATETPARELAEPGADSSRQSTLESGEDVPSLDAVFWEGFRDEHGGLVADIASVTGRAAELQPQLPSADHAAILDHHIEGHFALEEALANAISTAQAGSVLAEDGEIGVDPVAVDAALDLWERTEVALDLLREHNGLYAAVLAQDVAGTMNRLSELAAALVESGLERAIAEAGNRTQEKLAAFEASWKVAALSVAKIPADVGVDMAVGATITAAVPVLLAVAGFTGTLPAVGLAAMIAIGASELWSWTSKSMGPDLDGLHANLSKLNGRIDVSADALALEHVGAGFRTGAEKVGNASLGLTVLLDAVASGIAIEGIYEAAAAWEAFKIEHAEMQRMWNECEVIFSGFLGWAAHTKELVTLLETEIGGRRLAIDSLGAIYGEGLYEV